MLFRCPISEIASYHWKKNENSLKKRKFGHELLQPNREPPKHGEIFKNPNLANTWD